MKELKSYISEGFFSNVGANNPIKRVIDTIKDASMNDKINSYDKMNEFTNLLEQILKDVESVIKKGKLVFEYIRNTRTCVPHTVIISLEILGSNDVRWSYNSKVRGRHQRSAKYIAFVVANDLYYEAICPAESIRHSIANTIKVTEFKAS